MDAIKQAKVNEFRNWLSDMGIQFMEKANGHFQIFDEDHKLAYQVWATTEKMISDESNGEGKVFIGTSKIHHVLEAWNNVAVPKEPTEELRSRFIDDYLACNGDFTNRTLVVAVRLPSHAVEVISNTQEIESKIQYYLDKYDGLFRLKVNPQVRIVGYMLV